MNKIKYYYQDEKLQIIPFVMAGFGLVLMAVFTVFKITDPDNWAPNGYLLAMGFMFLWTWIAFAFAYYTTIKPRSIFLKEKADILNNGKTVIGEIIDSSETVKTYVNGRPSSWVYYAEVKFDDGFEEKTFWTPALLFNPKNLLTTSVTVYCYNNKYFATDFQVSENPVEMKEDTLEVENNYRYNDNAFHGFANIISGLIFTGFCLWIFINAADIITRIAIVPFTIAGIGILLKGLSPLLFKNKLKNLGMKIYLFGFSLFWFGFLIVFDYLSITQGDIQLALFSIIFWIVGLAMIINQFKRYR